MVERKGSKGPFLACLGYPTCKHAEPLPASKKSSSKGAKRVEGRP